MQTPLQAIWEKYQSGSYIFSTHCWLCFLHIWHLRHMDHSLINSPEYHHFEHLSENSSKNGVQFSISQEHNGDIWFSERQSKWYVNSPFFLLFEVWCLHKVSLLERQQVWALFFKLFTGVILVGKSYDFLFFFFVEGNVRNTHFWEKFVFCKIVIKVAANYNPVFTS